jgi:hypothetical protein
MTKRPDSSAKDVAEGAVETDFSIPADADLRPSPADDDAHHDADHDLGKDSE